MAGTPVSSLAWLHPETVAAAGVLQNAVWMAVSQLGFSGCWGSGGVSLRLLPRPLLPGAAPGSQERGSLGPGAGLPRSPPTQSLVLGGQCLGWTCRVVY